MPRIIAHIGQPKAASSSLQSALWESRERLRDSGVVYPDLPERNHNPAVADFLADRVAEWMDGFPRGRALLDEQRRPGAWNFLAQAVKGAPLGIVSSELLSGLGHRAAAAVVAELGGESDVEVLLVVRRASQAIPSAYGQAARIWPTVTFEAWLRGNLRPLLWDQTLSGVRALDAGSVRAVWSSVAPVTEVAFDTATPSEFEEGVITALGIADIVPRPFLQHKNPGFAAATIVAWQRFQRRHPTIDPLLVWRGRWRPPQTDSLPGGGGRFALAPDVAELADVALSAGESRTNDEATEARVRLGQRTTLAEPMTTVGITDEELEAGVQMCLEDLERTLIG